MLLYLVSFVSIVAVCYASPIYKKEEAKKGFDGAEWGHPLVGLAKRLMDVKQYGTNVEKRDFEEKAYGHGTRPTKRGYGHQTRPTERGYGHETRPTERGYGHETRPTDIQEIFQKVMRDLDIKAYGHATRPSKKGHEDQTPPVAKGKRDLEKALKGYDQGAWGQPLIAKGYGHETRPTERGYGHETRPSARGFDAGAWGHP